MSPEGLSAKGLITWWQVTLGVNGPPHSGTLWESLGHWGCAFKGDCGTPASFSFFFNFYFLLPVHRTSSLLYYILSAFAH